MWSLRSTLMTEWTTSVSRDIAADAKTLYDLVADVTRMGEWSPENHTCTWKDGFDRPVVGAEWFGDNKNGEFEWQTEGRVTEAVPGQLFAFDANRGAEPRAAGPPAASAGGRARLQAGDPRCHCAW